MEFAPSRNAGEIETNDIPSGDASLRSETGNLAVLGLLARLGQGGSVFLAAAVLEPSTFGRLGVLLGLQVLGSMVAAQWFEPAVIRTGSTELNRRGTIPFELASRVVRLQTVGSAVSLAIVPAIALLVGIFVPIPWFLIVAAIFAAFVRSFALFLPTALFRAVGDVSSVQRLIGACWGSALVFRALGMAIGDFGLAGFIIGDLIAAALFAFVARRRVSRSKQRRAADEAPLTVGWRDAALLPHFIAMWALGYVDRFVLFGSIDDELLGQYEISYQLAAVVGIVSLELARAAMGQYALTRGRRDGALRARLKAAEHSYGLVVFGMASIGAGMSGLLWSRIPPLAAYGEYDGTLGIVAAAQLPLAAYALAAVRISNVTGQTQRLWICSVGGSVAGLAVLTQIVPTTDLRRVAAASFVGYSVTMLIAWASDSSDSARRRAYFSSAVLVVSAVLAAVAAWMSGSTLAMLVLVVVGTVALAFGTNRWLNSASHKEFDLVDLSSM